MSTRAKLSPVTIAFCDHAPDRAHEALRRTDAGHPRAKTAIEARADEIEAEAAENGRSIDFDDATRFARGLQDASRRADLVGVRDRHRINAAAWLLVAQRMLAKEAGR